MNTKIAIKKGLILEIPKLIKKLKLEKNFAIITDSKVKKLYGGKLLWNLRKAGFTAELFSFPEGEKSKNLHTIERISEQMIEKSFDRSSVVIALGGGVVGDIAGMVASIFMRGIPIVQIPTTLLAMIDSSIGGKTGVNLKNGKNLLGTFHLPTAVFIDPYLLKTLARKHLKNGLAEAIKYGVIKSPKLFNFIEKNLTKILHLDYEILEKLIEDCVKIKTEIVKKDPTEKGLRMILNYGHTFGHAIERLSNYTLLHGFAISLGMVLANQKAVKLGLLSLANSARIKNLLKKADLPVYTMHKPTSKDVIHDKKTANNAINFVLPKRIGEVVIYKEHKTIIPLKGSKSISNRALLLAYLAKLQTGKNSSLKNLSDCEDTIVMQKALKNFHTKKIDVKDCGTAFRFLTALKFATNNKVKITGSKRLLSRPIKPLTETLKNLGGKIKIPGNISSQFISALLMVAPLAKTTTTIKITGEIFSKPYIEITLNLLKKFGIKITHDKNLRTFKIAPNQRFKPCDLFIEGDASSASYWGEYAALFNKEIIIKNIQKNSIQGDIEFLKYLKKMGCKIRHEKNLIKITGPKSYKNLRPLGTIDMNETPDLVPTFAVLSAFANGTTKIINIANLRIKESDRISALEKELKKIGVKVKTGKDFIEIHGNPATIKKNAIIDTYNDHRIAMAFGVKFKVKNPSVVKKSYPLFWSQWMNLRNQFGKSQP